METTSEWKKICQIFETKRHCLFKNLCAFSIQRAKFSWSIYRSNDCIRFYRFIFTPSGHCETTRINYIVESTYGMNQTQERNCHADMTFYWYRRFDDTILLQIHLPNNNKHFQPNLIIDLSKWWEKKRPRNRKL